MSVTKTAFRGGLWLAGLTAIGQAISWGVTIFVARLLEPEAYGLMDKATIFTGYVQIFYQLGIGSAIIQRKEVNDEELSSLFWTLTAWGVFLAVMSLLLAYPTVSHFSQPDLFPVTQSVAVLFILGALLIVPRNLLNRRLRFKAAGAIGSASVIASCIAMLFLAYHGYGVWTLVGGHIIRELVKVVLSFIVVGWFPKFHFTWKEVKPYLSFGIPVMGSHSLGYVYTRADVFVGGPLFTESVFGFYSLAQRLASMPNDKLLSIIHSISYPVFSRYQDDRDEMHNFYLKLSKLIGILVLPIYGGGIFVAGELIPILIGDKWGPCVPLFQLLCLSQLITSLTAVDAVINNSLGKPKWTFSFSLVAACTMVPAFYFVATKESLLWLCLPWAILFPVLRIGFHMLTVRGMGLGIIASFKPFLAPTLATLAMLAILEGHKRFRPSYGSIFFPNTIEYLLVSIFLGVLFYTLYVLIFERSFIQTMKNQLKPD